MRKLYNLEEFEISDYFNTKVFNTSAGKIARTLIPEGEVSIQNMYNLEVHYNQNIIPLQNYVAEPFLEPEYKEMFPTIIDYNIWLADWRDKQINSILE